MQDVKPETLMGAMKVSQVANALQLFHFLHDMQDSDAKLSVCIIDGLGPALQGLRAGSTHHHQGTSQRDVIIALAVSRESFNVHHLIQVEH